MLLLFNLDGPYHTLCLEEKRKCTSIIGIITPILSTVQSGTCRFVCRIIKTAPVLLPPLAHNELQSLPCVLMA
ncbi:hypothetical protein FJTKL_05441 [Diaporthe vaccinii]|uniref:Uncharacterized protein n=1 Tax=Diaporthe vaccinii TaxID=105482 RepID=A0ABR4FFV6_9PEZI